MASAPKQQQPVLMGRTRPAIETKSGHGALTVDKLVSQLVGQMPEHLNNVRHAHRIIFKTLFMRRHNAAFSEDWRAALRGAICALLLAFPIIMPRGSIPWLHDLETHQLYNQSTTILFLFSIYKPLGPTTEMVTQGVLGVLLWFLVQTGMNAWFPAGATDAFSISVFAIVGIVFTAVVLFLNLSANTVMWTLGSFVFGWMNAFNPAMSSSDGQLVVNGQLVCTITAGLFCLVVNLVPYPLLSMYKCKQTATDLVSLLQLTWSDFADHYCAQASNTWKQDRLARDLREIHTQVDLLGTHILDAWWETRLSSRWRHCRRMLKRLHFYLLESYNRLLAAQQACTQEGDERSHATVVSAIRTPVSDVIADAGMLLVTACEASSDGVISMEEKATMQVLIEKVEASVRDVTTNFATVKAEAGFSGISEDLIEEHVFCYEVCALGRSAVEFAKELLEHDSGRVPLKSVREAHGLWGIFDLSVVLDPVHFRTALLRTVKVLLSFALGYFPLRGVTGGYDAGIANIQVVLTNQQSTGSAMMKNLARLQGVVIGTVGGQIIHAIFGFCDPWSITVTAILFVSWVFASLFIYYSSVQYANSYTGFLLAVFGSYGIVDHCSDGHIDPKKLYTSILEIVLALAITISVDALFAQRPSLQASAAFKDVWVSMRAASKCLFNADEQNLSFSSSRIAGKAREAAVLGAEAAQEPRYWRAPWKEALFTHAVECARTLKENLSSIEHTAAENGADGGPKCANFLELISLPTFRSLVNILDGNMDLVERLLRIFEHDVATRMDALDDPAVLLDGTTEWKDALRAFIVDADKVIAIEREARPEQTLEDDPAAQVSLIAVSMNCMRAQLCSLRHAMLLA